MPSRNATLQNGSFTWDDTSTIEVPHGTTVQVDLYAVSTTFASSNPLQWNGAPPSGSSVSPISSTQLLLSVPNALEESVDKTYHFFVVGAARAQVTSNLTILLKGNPG